MRKIYFGKPEEAVGDWLIIPVLEGESLSPFTLSLDDRLEGSISYNLNLEKFTGKEKEILFITTNGKFAIPKILCIGVGKKELLSSPKLLDVGGFAASKIIEICHGCKLAYDATLLETLDLETFIPLGLLLREWKFDKYKNKPEEPDSTLQVLSTKPSVKETFQLVENLYQSISHAKELASEPANYVYPEVFASRCLALKELGIEVEVLDEKALYDLEANGILSVGMGSFRPPCLVVLKWTGKKIIPHQLHLLGKAFVLIQGDSILRLDLKLSK